MKPTIGRIVWYALSEQDVQEIERRRTTSVSIAERMKAAVWPFGAQAHLGNPVKAGNVVPAIVTAVWGDFCVNLRAVLDGTDEYWATSRNLHAQPDERASSQLPEGRWMWPTRD